MIYLVTGPPGNGKSFYAIRKIVGALEGGKVVAGNVQLVPGWPRRIAARSWPLWFRRLKRRKFIEGVEHRYHYTEDLSELASLRICFCGADHDDPDDWCKCREGRGLMVLDEGHNWMNARSWSAEDRKEIVRFFSQHRKLGWDIILIAQHAEMIDKQVRNLVEYVVSMRNLKKARWAGVPIFPINLFLAVWQWHSANRVVVKREVMRLTGVKRLYDTNATSHGLKVGGDKGLIWLPSDPSGRIPATDGPAGRTDARTDAERPGARPPARLPARDGDATGEAEGLPAEAEGLPAEGLPSSEAAQESGEPEAWPVEADYRRVD